MPQMRCRVFLSTKPAPKVTAPVSSTIVAFLILLSDAIAYLVLFAYTYYAAAKYQTELQDPTILSILSTIMIIDPYDETLRGY